MYGNVVIAFNQIIVVGGVTSQKEQSSKFDIATNTWHKMPSLSTHRNYYPCVFLLGTTLYIGGGGAGSWSEEDKFLDTMETLDLSSDGAKWQPSPVKLPSKMVFMSCTTINDDTVIMTGGYDYEYKKFDNSCNILNKAWKWSVGDISWTDLPDMNNAGISQIRYSHCSVTDDSENVYVVGGLAKYAIRVSIEKYNGISWQEMDTMPIQKYYQGCVYRNGKIYVLGGGIETDILVYEISSDTWSTISPGLQHIRQYLHVGLLPFKMN